MYKILKDGRPPVNPESSVVQHPKIHHHVLSVLIPGYGPFNRHQLILSEWCLDLEQIQSCIQIETLKGKS